MRTLLTFASVSLALALGIVSIAHAEHPARVYLQQEPPDQLIGKITAYATLSDPNVASVSAGSNNASAIESTDSASGGIHAQALGDINNDGRVDINDLL